MEWRRLPSPAISAMMPSRRAIRWEEQMRIPVVNLRFELWPPPHIAGLPLALAACVLATALMCCGAAHADFFRPSTGRWCALTAVGVNDCSYDTAAQCMATVSGVGGVCNINPQAPQDDDPPPRPPRRRPK
jgi:hypothetical protein